jgi:large subunit ribosomal protein L18
MRKNKTKKLYLQKRKRIFSRIVGTILKPRLSIFKSNKNIYAQLINDYLGHTLVSYNTLNLKKEIGSLEFRNTKKAYLSFLTGQKLAIKSKEKSINNIVFDRGNKRYHGHIKQFAEGARNQGLIF